MDIEDFINEVMPLKNKIFRLARRLMSLQVEAEDITQDVFMRLWNKKNDLTQLSNIEAFAMAVTKNLCLDRIKTQKPASLDPGAIDIPNVDKGPQKIVETSDDNKLINNIIKKLPEQQQLVLHLRDIEGLEYEEIGTITGLNVNAVRVNLSRGRKTLRDELTKTYNYGLETR